jgi:hypothetical protein
MQEPFKELWATYSVKDHQQLRAFIADVLFYDRLVIPVPSRELNETRELNEVYKSEWDRWEKKNWDPALQESLLEVLQFAGKYPVVEKVLWDSKLQGEWKARMVAENQGEPVRKDTFMETRSVLIETIPFYTWGVAAIGATYRSLMALENELGVKDTSGHRTILPSGALAVVLGQEFLFVDDPNLSHKDMLKKAVELATDDEYRGVRASLTAWEQKFLKDDKTDAQSIHRAVEEMYELLEKRNAVVRNSKIQTAVSYVFRFGVLPAGLVGGLLAGPLGAIIGAAGATFLSVGEVTVNELFFKKTKEDGPEPAAFLQDIQRHFGWELHPRRII